MIVELTPIQVNTKSDDRDGRLALANGRLVAVLVRLGPSHERQGHWYSEHGFGQLDRPEHPLFSSLEEAAAWIERELGLNGYETER